MKNIFTLLNHMLADIRLTGKYWLIVLLVAVSWSYLAGVLYVTNAFGYYQAGKVLKAIIFLPFFYLLFAWLVGHFIIAPKVKLSRSKVFELLIACTVLAILVILVFPPPIPGLPQAHQLKLVVLDQRNDLSNGQGLEIVKLRNLDGRPIPWETLQLSGDWQVVDNKLVSGGRGDSTFQYIGSVFGGVVFNLLYDDQSGLVEIDWDGISQEFDLYAPVPTILNVIFEGQSWDTHDLLPLMILGLTAALYITGIASIFLLVLFGVELTGSKRLVSVVLICMYLLTFLDFIKLKALYPAFNAERVFRDTYSYVAGAEVPLSSVEFWVGERTFTLPLVFKLLGVNTQNYQTVVAMQDVSQFQTWLSISCWSFLGLVFGLSLHKRWLGVGAFGVIALFSLCLEISLWDSLVLSESVSLSLFAGLVGLWVVLEVLPRHRLQSVTRWLLFFLMVIVTVLYSFTRDTNLYFVVLCGPFFALLAWIRKKDQAQRIFYSAYAVVVIALFVFQNYSVNSGNRWQILIYDHLALRMLKDEQAIKFLESKGLPVDDALMQVTDMTPPDFQKYFLTSDEMTAVREWVNTKGKSIYLQYLLMRPVSSLLEPVQESGKLLNGSSVEYRREKLPARPIPEIIHRISMFLYPRSPWVLGFMLVLCIAGSAFWIIGGETRSVWLIILALVASLYPLMFIVWHGNPQEIERHAVQITVQFRLAGWMALITWLGWLSTVNDFRKEKNKSSNPVAV